MYTEMVKCTAEVFGFSGHMGECELESPVAVGDDSPAGGPKVLCTNTL